MAPARLHALTLFASLLLGLAAGSADAQQPTQAQTNAMRQSCRSDYQAHCANVPTGGSAALQCLKNNMAGLSPGCQAAVVATEGGTASGPPPAASQGRPAPAPMGPMSMREEAAMMRNACGGDFRAYCRGVRMGGGRALACLADHQESLSPPCRDALAAARGAR